MSGQSHRILVDLAPATEGFAGIPHEARLIWRTLWNTPGLDPTALLYDNGLSVLTHRFAKRFSQGRQLENHASFLFRLSQRNWYPATNRWLRRWERVKRLWRSVFAQRATMQFLDNAAHGESVWRLFLSQSLGKDGLDMVRNCPMAIANLGRTIRRLRAYLRLPAISLDTSSYDFILLHEQVPLRVSPHTCTLIRYQDMIPALRPELVGSRHQIVAHMRGIRRCTPQSVFVCSSEPTRADLLKAFPELEERTVTIPAVLGTELHPEHLPEMVPMIVRSRQAVARNGNNAVLPGPSVELPRHAAKGFPPYLLMVSTIEPRKNHLALIRAFEKLLAQRKTDLVLVFVGSSGWNNKEIFLAMQPLIRQGRLFHLEKVPPQELRLLYSHAEALVFPSFYEGFGYSPLEAMQCGCPAIASDIPAHRWVCGEAVLYCDPFDPDDLRHAIERLVFDPDASLRRELVHRGNELVHRYSSEEAGRQWLALCEEIRRQGGGKNVAQLRLSGLTLQKPMPQHSHQLDGMSPLQPPIRTLRNKRRFAAEMPIKP